MNLDDLLSKYAVLLHITHDRLSIDMKNVLGDGPIHVAVWQRDLQAISILAEAGADLNAEGEGGFTPAQIASINGDDESLSLLTKLGANHC